MADRQRLTGGDRRLRLRPRHLQLEENGEPRAATRAELDYFNDEFSGEIADEGAEYWYEKCH